MSELYEAQITNLPLNPNVFPLSIKARCNKSDTVILRKIKQEFIRKCDLCNIDKDALYSIGTLHVSYYRLVYSITGIRPSTFVVETCYSCIWYIYNEPKVFVFNYKMGLL